MRGGGGGEGLLLLVLQGLLPILHSPAPPPEYTQLPPHPHSAPSLC